MTWSLGTVVIIVIVSFASGLLSRVPTDELLNRWGSGVRGLLHGKLWTILTSNFLIDHPVAIISTVVLAVVATGVCELFYGTWRAALAWFVGTWAPLLLAAVLLIPTHLLHAQGATDRLMISEVGSSTATWCCAGAVVGYPWLVRGWRRLAGVAAFALLVAILVLHTTFTDLEHMVALGSGMALQRLWWNRPSNFGLVTRETAARIMTTVCGVVFLIEVYLTGLGSGSVALLPIGALLIGLSLLDLKRIDVTLAILLTAGAVLANVLLPNAATILAAGAALWLLLYRGQWTLPEQSTIASSAMPEDVSRRP